MQSLRFDFEALKLVRTWPEPIACGGWVDIHYDATEWGPGDMGIHLCRHGEEHETRLFHVGAGACRSDLRRLARLQQALLADADLCMQIDERISEEIASRGDLAADARYRDAREAAA